MAKYIRGLKVVIRGMKVMGKSQIQASPLTWYLAWIIITGWNTWISPKTLRLPTVALNVISSVHSSAR